MSANKIVLNKEVLIDLTTDTVTEPDVTKGIIFHKADGTTAVGTKEEKILIEKEITANGEYPASADGADGFSKVVINVVDNPLPTEISTEEEMTALLESAEVGAIYKYTGETTDTYENGAMYIVEEVSE